jgi:hypothetical protein
MEKEINNTDMDSILKIVDLSETDVKLGRVKTARELLAERRPKEKDEKLVQQSVDTK